MKKWSNDCKWKGEMDYMGGTILWTLHLEKIIIESEIKWVELFFFKDNIFFITVNMKDDSYIFKGRIMALKYILYWWISFHFFLYVCDSCYCSFKI